MKPDNLGVLGGERIRRRRVGHEVDAGIRKDTHERWCQTHGQTTQALRLEHPGDHGRHRAPTRALDDLQRV